MKRALAANAEAFEHAAKKLVATSGVGLLWLRSDLRVRDNRALHHLLMSQRCASIVALFVVSASEWNAHNLAPIRVRNALANLKALEESLKKINIPLVVINNPATRHAVPQLVRDTAVKIKASAVAWNIEYEVHELERDAKTCQLLSEANIAPFELHDQCIVDPGKVRTKEGKPYTVFTPFKKTWIESLKKDPSLYAIRPDPQSLEEPPQDLRDAIDNLHTGIPDTLPVPYDATLPPDTVVQFVEAQFPPGEEEARTRLLGFVEKRGKAYKDQRDLPFKNGTSGLSPYLAIGVLSARECLVEALRVNNQKLDSGSDGLVTWISELCWRDFYKQILIEFPRVCKNLPFKLETDRVPWRTDAARLDAWREGRTGFPLVDAGMRQLAAEGWMHNRVRMVVACFFVKDLGLDWRLGEKEFMRRLVDGDFSANNGGWQWSAGTGTDAQPYFRVFNPVLQSERFDSEGMYIRKYVPELRGLSSNKEIHDPLARMGKARFAKLKYPEPIVDHKVASKEFVEGFKKAVAKE
ncbi:deoxyribodipyrimidine photo-lyase type I [Chytriomyces sp. MP71]|nr:deoxyribodipyrimidine photo-lyase type I [Chytriomyces sp. MP71]